MPNIEAATQPANYEGNTPKILITEQRAKSSTYQSDDEMDEVKG